MIVPVFAVLGSCVTCMSLVELLAKSDPGCMNLMTFATFLFISAEGFFFATKCLSIKNKIPILRGYMKLVVIFFMVSTINNLALSYRIPVPLHIIFRSGSLLASMVLGIIILKRSYSVQKYLSIAAITVGIVLCTLASSSKIKVDETEDKTEAYSEYALGIGMLLFALVASAYMGIVQEQLYSQYGKHPREALFYVHALSLPGFAFFWQSIWKHVVIFNVSDPIDLPVVGHFPKLWLYLILVCLAQFTCIRCVYVLTSEFSALSVTLVVTLRKFISLLLSIWYFENPFTLVHWVGTVLVFAGTLIFSDIVGQVRNFVTTEKKKSE